jgi:hypothetical protein
MIHFGYGFKFSDAARQQVVRHVERSVMRF